MEANAGGIPSGEGIESRSLLLDVAAEARRLQLEHRPVPSAGCHQFFVGAELDHLAVFEDADAVGVAHGGEAVRNQDGGGVRAWR